MDERSLNDSDEAVLEGRLWGEGFTFALVASRFNEFFVRPLVHGARSVLVRHGVRPEDIAEVWVPGSFELPLAAKRVAESGAFSGIVALGVVMRGETAHFDYVAGEASSGLARVAWETGVPVGFALLTLDDAEQAIHRAGGKAGNKGAEAALAALEMANLLRDLPDFARKFRRRTPRSRRIAAATS